MAKITLQMYTLRKSMETPEDLDNTFRRVADMGYKSIQITPPKFTNTVEMAAQIKNYGLTADSVMCDVYSIPDKLDEIARGAEALGTDVLRTNSIRKEDRLTPEGYKAFAAHMNKCGKLLRDMGLDFMYHFHAFEWIDFGGVRGMDILLNETDPNYVMFQPDVFWMTCAGLEPSRDLELFKGRIRYIHCKDYLITKPRDGVLERFTYASGPVGIGNLRWNDIFKTAERIGVENYVVEDDIGRLDPFDSAQISFDNLTKMAKEQELA